MFNPYRKRGNKYGRKKVELDGHVFDSKLEAKVYQLLKENPQIKKIEFQDKVYLTKAKILAKIDFKVTTDNETYWVEAKGMDLATWNLKKRLWKYYGPGKLEIYKRDGLDQTIIAENPEAASAPL